MGDSSLLSDSDLDETLRISRMKDKELETMRQENHQLKANLHTMGRVQEDLHLENESLQKELSQLQAKALEEKLQLSLEFKSTIKQLKEEVEEGKVEVLSLQEKLVATREELETKLASTNKKPVDFDQTLKEEVKELSRELVGVSQVKEHLQEELQTAVVKIRELEEQLEEARNLEQHHQQRAEGLKEKLEQAEQDLEHTQEELQQVRLELMSCTPTPEAEDAEGRRGNSLFSEVDDHRQVVVDRLKKFQTEVMASRQQISNLRQEIAQLKMLNVELHAEWKKYEDQKQKLIFMDSELMANYESKIKSLKKYTEELEEENIARAPASIPDMYAQCTWVQSMVQKHREQIAELNGKIQEQKLRELGLEQCRLKSAYEEHTAIASKNRLQGEVKRLTLELEELKDKENKELLPQPSASNVVSLAPTQFNTGKTQPLKDSNKTSTVPPLQAKSDNMQPPVQRELPDWLKNRMKVKTTKSVSFQDNKPVDEEPSLFVKTQQLMAPKPKNIPKTTQI